MQVSLWGIQSQRIKDLMKSRARRVKCDEGKPSCRRCIMGDRKCEYNAPKPPARSSNFMTVYLPPAKSQPTFFVNSDGLDFFHHNLAAKLDGQFDSEFWSKLVLQLSHSEPAIKHAVSAVSVIHRDVESSMNSPSGYTAANPAASKEWNAAMQALSSRILSKPNSNLVPLVCCLIFTCIEFMKGNVDSALVHIQSGFKILAMVRSTIQAEGDENTTYSDEDIKAIEEHIVPMFSRLNALCTLFGRVTPPVLAIANDAGETLHNLADARQRLYEAMDPAIRFIRSAGRRAEGFELTMDDFAEQIKLQNALDTWRTEFEDLIDRLKRTDKPANQEAVSLLLVQFLVVHTWLAVCTTAEETAIDSYNPAFLELIECAEHVVNSYKESGKLQPVSFDMQVIGPLYYTTVKCRDPTLRRRALSLLKLAPRREGLWNAHHAFVTARRVIELEEGVDRNAQGLPAESGRLRGVNLPSDEARVYNHSRMPGEHRRFDGSIVPSPSMPGVIEVLFQTKPQGPLGPWHTFTEHIIL